MRQQSLGKWFTLLAAFVVMAAALLVNVAPSAHAEETSTDITLASAVVSSDDTAVTLTFNVSVAANPDVTDLASQVGMKGTLDATYTSEDISGAEIVDGTLVVHLNNPLNATDSVLIRILAGALQGSEDASYQLTSNLISDPIVGVPLPPPPSVLESPTFKSVLVADDLQHVKITFSTPVTVSEGYYSSLENGVYAVIPTSIKLGVSYEAPLSLSTDDTVTVSGDEMHITLATALNSSQSGGYTIQLPSGVVKNEAGINKTTSYAIGDLRVPTLSSASVGGSNSSIYLTFNTNVSSNGWNADELKGKFTITPPEGGTVPNFTISGINTNGTGSGNTASIQFDSPLAIGTYQLVIAHDALKSAYGMTTSEDLTATLTVRELAPPVYQSAELGPDRQTVTLTFDENLKLDDYLPDCITVYQNEKELDVSGLIDEDNTRIDGNTVVIAFTKPLTGTGIRIKLDGYTLKDENDNILYDVVLTEPIDAANPDLPAYEHSAIGNFNQDWTLYFDGSIVNNTDSDDALKAAIALSVNGGIPQAVAASTTVTIADRTIVLHFADPLADPNIQVLISPGTLAGESSGDALGSIVTEALTPNDLYPPELSQQYLMSVHTAVIRFNKSLLDNTPGTDESNLKTALTYSTDGTTFVPLGADDSVKLQSWYQPNDALLVYIHDAVSGGVQIRIAANTLKDTLGNVLSTDVTTDTLTYDEAPYFSGDFYTDAPSVITFIDDAAWRSKIVSLKLQINDSFGSRYQPLTPDDYTIAAGKITVRQGLFKDGYYRLYVYADGYQSRQLGTPAHSVQSSYAMGPVMIDSTNGITASVEAGPYNSNGGPATVIFQLMDGETPVSIAAMHTDRLNGYGTFKAHFNVADAATNPDYTVRAFVVDQYSNSPSTMGYNLASQLSNAEIQANADLWRGDDNDN